MRDLHWFAKLCSLELPHQNLPIDKVEVDSRQIASGGVFVALKGERTDGHLFLAEARERGAVAALVGPEYQGPSYGLILLKSRRDSLSSLQQGARELLSTRSGRVIGITGSIGKTTTKECLAALLSTRYQVAKSEKSLNGQIGLPLSIFNAPAEWDFLILEMGMTFKGEMARLVEIAPLDYGLVTYIAKSHIAHFNSIEEIAQEKMRIFDSEKMEGRFVSEQALSFAPPGCSVLSFDHPLKPFNAAQLNACFALAAQLAGNLGVSIQDMEKVIPHMRPAPHRFEMIEKGGVIFIDDSYNANVESMCAALSNLPTPREGGRRIAVLGSMGELGSYEEEAHTQVGRCAKGKIDLLFCLGEECLPLIEAFEGPAELSPDFKTLQQRVHAFIQPADVVLVKGSNRKALWRLVESYA